MSVDQEEAVVRKSDVMTVENNIKVMRTLKLISETVVQNDLGSLDTIEYIRCSRVLAGSNGENGFS